MKNLLLVIVFFCITHISFAAFPLKAINTASANHIIFKKEQTSSNLIPQFRERRKTDIYVQLSQVGYIGFLGLLVGALTASFIWLAAGTLILAAGFVFSIMAVTDHEPGAVLNLVYYCIFGIPSIFAAIAYIFLAA
jgi:hypothetical protein